MYLDGAQRKARPDDGVDAAAAALEEADHQTSVRLGRVVQRRLGRFDLWRRATNENKNQRSPLAAKSFTKWAQPLSNNELNYRPALLSATKFTR